MGSAAEALKPSQDRRHYREAVAKSNRSTSEANPNGETFPTKTRRAQRELLLACFVSWWLVVEISLSQRIDGRARLDAKRGPGPELRDRFEVELNHYRRISVSLLRTIA